MAKTICGLDCSTCGGLENGCKGCAATGGKPFGGDCILANCAKNHHHSECETCDFESCAMKKELIAEFNALGIADMPEITDLWALKGSVVNIAYPLPSGKNVPLWDDDKVIFGNQVEKPGSDRCYGLAADEKYIMVAEYGENGTNAEIVVFKRR